MPKTDLKIYSTDAGTGAKITSSVSYVNPNASSSVLKSFAQQLNALTTNNYTSADRIDTTNVDTEDPTPITKSFRETTITGATRGGTATITYNVTMTQQGTPFVVFLTDSGSGYSATYLPTTDGTTTDTQKSVTCTVPNSGGYIYAGLLENNIFYADFIRVEVS